MFCLVALVCLQTAAATAAVAFRTKPQLETAVDAWLDDPRAAVAVYGNITTWNTSLITDMSELFCSSKSGPHVCWHAHPRAHLFDDDISGWDTRAVTSMQLMFRSASSFNAPIGSWDVGAVRDMSSMFRGATTFDAYIGRWDVSQVRATAKMFFYATSFTGAGLGAWDITLLADANEMFAFASSFNTKLGWCFPGDARYAFYDTKCAATKCGIMNVNKCRRIGGALTDDDAGDSRNYGNHPILFGAVILSSLVVLFMLVGTGCKCRANTRKKVIVHVKTDFRGEPDTVLALEA